MFKTFKADLHIHTCLSPCADPAMSPGSIVEQAKIKGIDILGICDHNSAENVPALIGAAEKHSIHVLAGLEVTSQEEVHVLGLFDGLESAFRLQDVIYRRLPGENDERAFGTQAVVNENGEILHFNEKLLIGASTLSLEEVIELIHSFNGLAIASHIDRESYSLISQLGFIPGHLSLDAVEVSPQITREEAARRFKVPFSVLCSSDAHFLEDIGKGSTSFCIQEATTVEIKKALKREGRRKILH